MRSARGRFRVLSSLFLASLLLTLFGSAASATSLTPTPSNAPNDTERLWDDGCFSYSFTQTKPKDGCVFGDRTSTYKMAIVGDSHTSDLFAAFNRIAKAHGWKLYTFRKADCPFIDVQIRNAGANWAPYPACYTWNQNVLSQLKKIKPDLTVTIPFRWIRTMHGSSSATATGAAIGRMLKQLTGEKIVIVDTPYSNFDVPSCVAAHGANACKIPKSEVLSGGVKIREQEAARVAGGHYVNLTGKMCGGFPCRVVTGNVLEFRDRHHLTNTFAKAFAGTLNDAIKTALGITSASAARN